MKNNENSNSTVGQLVLSSESAVSSNFAGQASSNVVVRRQTQTSKGVVNAVYGYIRAIRALGRTEINTSEIAEALSLSVSDVNRAISSLKRRGVKVLNAA